MGRKKTEKEKLTKIFFDRVEKNRKGFRSCAGLVLNLTNSDEADAKSVASDYLAYKRASRFPSLRIIQTFSSLFTASELKQFYRTRDEGVKGYELGGLNIDDVFAVATFKSVIQRNVEDYGGSYKELVRSLDEFEIKEVNHITTTIRQLIDEQRIPPIQLLERMEELFTETEYLIIKRAIDDKNNAEDPNAVSDARLGEIMTETERGRQRKVRSEERWRMLMKYEIEQEGQENDPSSQKNSP